MKDNTTKEPYEKVPVGLDLNKKKKKKNTAAPPVEPRLFV